MVAAPPRQGNSALAKRQDAPRSLVESLPVISRVHSFVLQGIDACPCEIEVDLAAGPVRSTTIVGLPDTAVRESMQRVRTAIRNGGLAYPHGRITINLAPATLRKEGPVYDLPIAVAILAATDAIESRCDDGGLRLEDLIMGGELALDGRIRPIRGAISMALLARRRGMRGVVVPRENAAEATAVGQVEVRGVATLGEVVALLNRRADVAPHPDVDVEGLVREAASQVDFADVRGQDAAKRALCVAAAGAHNVLMIGPAGTGKTMMARALPGVLPPLTREEALEVTRVYSCAGRLDRGQALVVQRPVRSPHHTASAAAVIGGGSVPRPGEVSLAHRGVLFLDEMPEFARDVLETLRQPLEEGHVTIGRAQGSVRFPARFMLVAALNPTPRGDAARDEVGRRAMEKYLGRISGPLVDRIDIHVEVPRIPYRALAGPGCGTDSATIRAQVLEARRRQSERQGPATPNAELCGRQLDRFARLDQAGSLLLSQAMTELCLSARAYDRIRRVARTIADLEGTAQVAAHHVAEAIQYRLLDRML
jgi:magnesium chelatase family protein